MVMVIFQKGDYSKGILCGEQKNKNKNYVGISNGHEMNESDSVVTLSVQLHHSENKSYCGQF